MCDARSIQCCACRSVERHRDDEAVRLLGGRACWRGRAVREAAQAAWLGEAHQKGGGQRGALLVQSTLTTTESSMSAAKQEVRDLLDKLPDDCSLEDVQYHLYVIEKVQRGIAVADEQGGVSQDEAEQRLAKWTSA